MDDISFDGMILVALLAYFVRKLEDVYQFLCAAVPWLKMQFEAAGVDQIVEHMSEVTSWLV